MEHRNNATTRFAVYARYASNVARLASIEDQVNNCTSAVADRNSQRELAESTNFTDFASAHRIGVEGRR